jgi:hypothetical protein
MALELAVKTRTGARLPVAEPRRAGRASFSVVGGARDESPPTAVRANGGVIGKVRDVADGLGHLVGQHLKLARLELTADLRTMLRRTRVIAILVAFLIVGYALAMAGLAVVLGGNTAIGVPLLAVGIAHVVLSGAGIVLASRRRDTHLMDSTVEQVGQSLNTLRLATTPALPATNGQADDARNGRGKPEAREKNRVL